VKHTGKVLPEQIGDGDQMETTPSRTEQNRRYSRKKMSQKILKLLRFFQSQFSARDNLVTSSTFSFSEP
jgi:hypothetical protein